MNEIFGFIGASTGLASLVAMVVLVGTWKGRVDERLLAINGQLNTLATIPLMQERLTRLEEQVHGLAQRTDTLWQVSITDPILSLKRRGLIEERSEPMISPEMQAKFGARGKELSDRLMAAMFSKPLPEHDSSLLYEIIRVLGLDVLQERALALDLTVSEYLALCLTSVRMEQTRRVKEAKQ